jgi:cytochrome c oxidase subunit II
MAVCAVIFLAVFGVMFYSIIKHRKSTGRKPANFHESVTVEILWTIIPFFIVIGLALPATKTVVEMKDTSNAEITIKTTGYQWKWGYDYLKGEGEGISFVSTLSTPREQINNQAPKSNTYLLEVDKPMVVPVNTKIRMITTANDVIHAWAVPAFGVKQDAIPGFVRDTWFKAEKVGVFRGQCSELCGKEHAFMPIVVEVKSKEDYTAWVTARQKEMLAKADDPNKVYTLDELKARGEKVYNNNCAVCHQANGKGGGAIPGVDGSSVVNGPYKAQMELLLNGKNGMPKWSQLSDTDLASVMTYSRNHWSNKTGELIQPADFVKARAGQYKEGGGVAGASASASASSADAKTVESMVKSESAEPASAIDAATATNASVVASAVASVTPSQETAVIDPATGFVKFIYFASGRSTVSDQDIKALEKLAAAAKADASKKINLSAFVDQTGNDKINAALAKKRAFAVRDALVKLGVKTEQVVLIKPENIKQQNSDAQAARRVEITLS